MLTPATYRERYAGRTVVPVSDPLTTAQVEELAGLGPVTLLALTGTGTPWLSPVGLVRATRAAAGLLPDAVVVTVPLPAHGDAEADHALGVQVVEAFAAGDPVHALADDEAARCPTRSPRWWTTTARHRTGRGWCCSSPASPAAASPRWPARWSTCCSSRASGP